MAKVTLDQNLAAKLRHLTERAELCDESGKTVGFFTPLANRSLYEGLVIPISDEEIEQAAKEKKGRPLADILADLEKQR